MSSHPFTNVNDVIVFSCHDILMILMLFVCYSWFFHSQNDNVVAVGDTIKLVDALRAEHAKWLTKSYSKEDFPELKPKVQVTIYDKEIVSASSPSGGEAGTVKGSTRSASWMTQHVECWEQAYSSIELWEWLFAQ